MLGLCYRMLLYTEMARFAILSMFSVFYNKYLPWVWSVLYAIRVYMCVFDFRFISSYPSAEISEGPAPVLGHLPPTLLFLRPSLHDLCWPLPPSSSSAGLSGSPQASPGVWWSCLEAETGVFPGETTSSIHTLRRERYTVVL